nr:MULTISPECIES: AIPR family protein [unclassified Synechocystis]
MRGIFYDNVRDFQGDNEVNTEISNTIQSSFQDLFVLLNNGITIVAEHASQISSKLTIEGFQVVNGCQTCHVLYNNKNLINDKIYISLKIIVSDDNDVKTRIIKATNQQTVVKKEELIAITDFQKELESYYEAQPEEYRLYYERRSKQYASLTNIEKVRIITIPLQIKAFSSMFLDYAHLAGRYHANLLTSVNDNIFINTHQKIAYYVSAYASYKIDYLLRNKQIDKKYNPFKYIILMGINLYLSEHKKTNNISSKKFASYCEIIKENLWDDDKLTTMISQIINNINHITQTDLDRSYAKTRSFIDTFKDKFK